MSEVKEFNFSLVHKTLDWTTLMKACPREKKVTHVYHTNVDWKKFNEKRDAVIDKVLNSFRELGGYVVLAKPNYHDEAYAVWVVAWDRNYYVFTAHEFPDNLSLVVKVSRVMSNVDRLKANSR